MIAFTKAHACGNDFLIVTEEAARGADWAEITRRLCARNTGIGADGIEFFAWTGPKSGRIRLHNADGSIAEISGNGTRCVAAWMAHERGLTAGDAVEITTDAGMRVCSINRVHQDGGFTVDVTTDMGFPTFENRIVKISDGHIVHGTAVNTGNPHFVTHLDPVKLAAADRSWQAIGREICFHADFPNQTNVEFFSIVSPTEIEIFIYERGVGPTTSSGTGSSASAVAAIGVHGCRSPLTVVAPGGAQTVAWNGPGTELMLTGPAALIARGEAF